MSFMRTHHWRAGAKALAVAFVVSWGIGCEHLSYPDNPATDHGASPADGPSSHVATGHDGNAWVGLSGKGREAMRVRDYAAAEQNFVAALAETGAFPLHDARVRAALGNLLRLAAIRQANGEWADADRLLAQVVRSAEAGRLADFGAAAPVMARQADHHVRHGDSDRAITLYETTLTLYGVDDPGQIAERIEIESLLGNLYLATGRPDEAEPLLRAVLRSVQSRSGPQSLPASFALVGVARLDEALGDMAQAEADYQRALAIQQEKVPGSLELASTEGQFAWFLLEQGRNQDAATQATAALSIFDERQVTGARLIAILDTLATAEARLGRNEIAEADFARALAAYDEADAPTRARLVELLDHYADFERSRGRGPKADALSARAARERSETVAGASLAD
jgi:tetratricopeptide (TPR) repeat protein